MHEILKAFMQRIQRTVNKTFSDVQVNKRFYKVDPKLRGDRVEVAFDPFSYADVVKIYSLRGEYLGDGTLHVREPDFHARPVNPQEKPKHNYLDLLVRRHQSELEAQTKGIDYRKSVETRPWPFHEFAKTIAQLLGNKGGLSSFSTDELEILKKTYNLSGRISKNMVKQAVDKAREKTFPYIVFELKNLLNQKEDC
jgi:hypothetical protein